MIIIIIAFNIIIHMIINDKYINKMNVTSYSSKRWKKLFLEAIVDHLSRGH